MNPRILVLGDVNVDLVIPLVERSLDFQDQDKPGINLHGGGTAANTAAALARLGQQVEFIGSVGDGGYGRWALSDLASEGIDISNTKVVSDVFTSLIIALIQEDGDRSIYVWPDQGGAHTYLQPGDISEELIRSSSWLHTTGLCLREKPVREAQLKAMEIACKAGLKVSLDLNLRLEAWGMDESLRKAFQQAVEYSGVIFGSGEEEIIPYSGEKSIAAGAKHLSDGKRIVIARQGAKGVLAVAPGEQFVEPAFPVEVVDTLGAGDAFNGGFIAAQLAGEDLQESVRWGNAAAALKVGKHGARGLPSRDELFLLLETKLS